MNPILLAIETPSGRAVAALMAAALLLTALTGMSFTRKNCCSWWVFVIPMHESTKELHRSQ